MNSVELPNPVCVCHPLRPTRLPSAGSIPDVQRTLLTCRGPTSSAWREREKIRRRAPYFFSAAFFASAASQLAPVARDDLIAPHPLAAMRAVRIWLGWGEKNSPSACFWRMVAAALSLSRAISEPVLPFPFFCNGERKKDQILDNWAVFEGFPYLGGLLLEVVLTRLLTLITTGHFFGFFFQVSKYGSRSVWISVTLGGDLSKGGSKGRESELLAWRVRNFGIEVWEWLRLGRLIGF